MGKSTRDIHFRLKPQSSAQTRFGTKVFAGAVITRLQYVPPLCMLNPKMRFLVKHVSFGVLSKPTELRLLSCEARVFWGAV
jgi:hypothetical protein